MHERTQRAIARLMFVFCCAVPTALTFMCVFVTWTPWYHNRALRTIQVGLCQDTGLIIEIEDFERVSPSTLHLHQIRVLEPETRMEVASVRRLEWVSGGEQTSILLHQAELQSSQLESTWQLIHDRFLCRPDHTSLPVKVVGNDLTIRSRTGSLPVRDVLAWIQPREDAVEATIQCVLANSSSNSPVDIKVRRDRSGEEPITNWTLQANGSPLPCSALAEYLPLMASLGSEAEFFGTMSWQLGESHWWVDLGGSFFKHVSLDRLFEQHAHRLSGEAEIHFKRCRIEPYNRHSDIVGSVYAKDGMIGRSLLMSSHQHLGFGVHMPEGVSDVEYDRLALAFDLNSTALKLSGICHQELGYFPTGVVLCRDGQALVQSPEAMLDALKLVTAIAPSHSVLVPLSKQTSWLMNVFVPPSRPRPRDDQAFPPRIRRLENSRGGPGITQP
jgi:hypothetical protein